jgi:hypothetical protein
VESERSLTANLCQGLKKTYWQVYWTPLYYSSNIKKRKRALVNICFHDMLPPTYGCSEEKTNPMINC